MLELYADILCRKGEHANLKKFARTVTNKVKTNPAILSTSAYPC